MTQVSADAHEIIPGLILGNGKVAVNFGLLKYMGVTHVLDCAIEIPTFHQNQGIVYKHIPLEDVPSQNISQYFEDSFQFIDNALRNGGKVFVHCAMGISRSASMLVAYMMRKYGQSYSKVLTHVRSIRAIASPNPGFQAQLITSSPTRPIV